MTTVVRGSAGHPLGRLLLVLLLVALAAGCVTRHATLYEWGSYEDQVYAMYDSPGAVPVEKQIEEMESDYQAARSANRPLPPGFHAHLGYLYYQIGKLDQSLLSFKTEEELFPESKQYMDLLISRLTQTAPK